MKITRVVLKNVGPHKALDIKVSAGLVGIVGPNGAGKSSFANSIYAALTNDFTRFGGVKADVISNTSEKEPSHIIVYGSHNGEDFVLERHLRPSKNKLIIGNEAFTKDGDINTAISNKLGISRTIIDSYVFVEQWGMFEFMSQTAASRAEAFRHLCGTGSSVDIHKACKDFVTNRSADRVADNSIELIEQLTQRKAKREEHLANMRFHKLKALSPERKASCATVLAEKTAGDKARIDAAELQTDMTETIEAINADTKLETELTAELTDLTSKIGNLKKSAELAKTYKDAAALLSAWTARYEAAKSAARQAKNAQLALVMPEAPSGVIDNVQLKTLSQTVSDLKVLQTQTEKIAKSKSAKGFDCQSCHQPVSMAYVARIKTEYEERAKVITNLTAQITQKEAWDKTWADYNAEAARLLRNMDTARKTLATTKENKPTTTASSFTEASASETISAYDAADKRHRKLQQELPLVTQQISINNDHLTKLISSGSKLSAVIAATPSDARVTEAKDLLAVHDAAAKAFAAEKTSASLMEGFIRETEEAIEKLRAAINKQEKVQALLQVVERTAEVFHWDSLPKRVAQANLTSIVSDINENLELFGSPFYVEADEDLTFLVHFPGKPPVKTRQLSGGQKVILAVAFRTAVGRVFGHDVGMMFLDEPTAGLDSDNIVYFQEALQQLSQRMSTDSQLVVITHVESLGTVFDQLIEIRKN